MERSYFQTQWRFSESLSQEPFFDVGHLSCCSCKALNYNNFTQKAGGCSFADLLLDGSLVLINRYQLTEAEFFGDKLHVAEQLDEFQWPESCWERLGNLSETGDGG